MSLASVRHRARSPARRLPAAHEGDGPVGLALCHLRAPHLAHRL